MAEKLRSGYTTGTHATACVVALLYSYAEKKDLEYIEIHLPNEKVATIEVLRESQNCYSSIKTDNDDLDVTKGCKIRAVLYEELPSGLKEQNPSLINIGDSFVYLYGGEGVGVVSKKGLKISPSFPAINPKPLEMIQRNSQKILKDKKIHLHVVIEVENGEELAKQTANAKVGVLGGISILGTTGIVKPVSSSAYIDSVAVEIAFGVANGCQKLYLTLGNSAYKAAQEKIEESCIVEIGNFVYDAIALAKEEAAKEIVFVCGIGKMTKVAQGFKNTHNRFGVIDFELLAKWVKEQLGVDVDIEVTLTVKGVSEELAELGLLEDFYKMIAERANKQLQEWFGELDVEAVILEQKRVLGW
ncbi:cobalt-precorrin-5B (C(1))-methyltransferase CbiD [Sulfurimonas sp.]